MRSWSLDILFLVFVAGIWFAAVYTRHHYIIDVLAGGATAVVGYALFEFLAERKPVKTWLNALLQRI
jgi:membrane-associated phospholipid phosphatase